MGACRAHRCCLRAGRRSWGSCSSTVESHRRRKSLKRAIAWSGQEWGDGGATACRPRQGLTVGDVHGDFKAEAQIGEGGVVHCMVVSCDEWHEDDCVPHKTRRTCFTQPQPCHAKSMPPLMYLIGPRHSAGAWRAAPHGLARYGTGQTWLLLHGGRAAAAASLLAPFDLARQRVIAPDQRWRGRLAPQRTHRPTIWRLVADLEALRRHLGLERWSLLGGSWGTVVAPGLCAPAPGSCGATGAARRLASRGARWAGCCCPAPGLNVWWGRDGLAGAGRAASAPGPVPACHNCSKAGSDCSIAASQPWLGAARAA